MCVGTNNTIYTNSMGVQMNNSNFCSETYVFLKKSFIKSSIRVFIVAFYDFKLPIRGWFHHEKI